MYLGFELKHHQYVQDIQEGVIYSNASDIGEDDTTNVA